MSKKVFYYEHGWASIIAGLIIGSIFMYFIFFGKDDTEKNNTTSNYMAILEVAAESCSLEVIKFLIKNNIVDINDTQSFGLTALHRSAGKDCLAVVKFLTEADANIEATDAFSWTPLHCAADEGYLEIVKLLLEKGANPNVRNKDGDTPKDIAIKKSRYNSNKQDTYREIIDLLS